MFNAHVTVDIHGCLTPDSRVYVHDPARGTLDAAVPERHPVGGILWAHRINAALGEIGWKMSAETDWDGSEVNRVRFKAVQRESS